jgi:hypothetical protein
MNVVQDPYFKSAGASIQQINKEQGTSNFHRMGSSIPSRIKTKARPMVIDHSLFLVDLLNQNSSF